MTMPTPEIRALRHIIWFVVGVLGTAVIVATVWNTVETRRTVNEVRHTQVVGSPIALRTEEILTVLKDCVTPAGKCYQRGQENQSKAVDQIQKIIVLSNGCADLPGVQTMQEITDCVVKGLKS
jgi:hypothetical protein